MTFIKKKNDSHEQMDLQEIGWSYHVVFPFVNFRIKKLNF